jgi:hypothetical protein
MRHLPIGAAFAVAVSAGFYPRGALAAGPETAAGPTTEAPMPEYPPPSTRWKVAGVGLGAASVFYGLGAGASYLFPDTPGMKDLRMPVIGPWLAISHNQCASNDASCGTILLVARAFLLALDGAAQAGSLAVMVEGLLMPTESVAATPGPRAPTTPPPGKPTPGTGDKNLFWVPTPMTVGAGLGAGVVGRF